jgi:hypothetical protein
MFSTLRSIASFFCLFLYRSYVKKIVVNFAKNLYCLTMILFCFHNILQKKYFVRFLDAKKNVGQTYTVEAVS